MTDTRVVVFVDGKERLSVPYDRTVLPVDFDERAIIALSYVLTSIEELRDFVTGLLDDRIQGPDKDQPR